MKIGMFRRMCAAAVACSLAVPAVAQNTGTRSAAEDARTARPNAGQAQPGQDQNGQVQPGQTTRPGATLRPTAPATGAIVEEQDNLPSGTRTANFPPQQGRQAQGQGRLGDAALARWIGADNESEIRISEVAQQKAQNEQVKQFAKMMIDEHTKLGQQLQQAARGQGEGAERSTTIEERSTTRRRANANETERPGRETNGQENNERENNASPNRSERNSSGTNRNDLNVAFQQDDDQNIRRNARNAIRDSAELQSENRGAGGVMRGGNNAAVTFHEQIKQECVASFTKELNSKNGAEFDKCYLGQQIMAHQGMIDTLKVADQYASADLKQTLQQARQSSEQHLQKAKDLMKQVENERQ